MRILRCMACKQVTENPNAICNECRKKQCTKCGKISVYRTQYDDSGKPYCPKCFRMVVALAVNAGRLEQATIESRLEDMERRIRILEMVITGQSNKNEELDTPIALPITADIDGAVSRMLDNNTEDIPDIQTRIQKDLESLHSKPEVSTNEDNPKD